MTMKHVGGNGAFNHDEQMLFFSAVFAKVLYGAFARLGI